MKTPKEIQADNIAHVMKNGPGISTAIRSYVIARDPENKRILLGGLGGMGVGEMWFDEQPYHKDKPGYAEAKIVKSDPTNPFGRMTQHAENVQRESLLLADTKTKN